jgi:ankyrin repeat protein
LMMMLDEGDVDVDVAIGGSTPLHLAAFEGSWHSVQILLEFNANVFALDTNGRTPAQVASMLPILH